MAKTTDRSGSAGARPLRARHHTSDANLDGIQAANAINPERGWGAIVSGVNVEIEPFWTTRPFRPGRSSPKADLGIVEDGAYVEFDAPPGLVRVPGISPRNIGIIPTPANQPFPLSGRNPVFVKVRRHFREF